MAAGVIEPYRGGTVDVMGHQGTARYGESLGGGAALRAEVSLASPRRRGRPRVRILETSQWRASADGASVGTDACVTGGKALEGTLASWIGSRRELVSPLGREALLTEADAVFRNEGFDGGGEAFTLEVVRANDPAGIHKNGRANRREVP